MAMSKSTVKIRSDRVKFRYTGRVTCSERKTKGEKDNSIAIFQNLAF